MGLVRSIARIGIHQVRNVVRLARREPLVTPSLTSMTLGEDDVRIAGRWLEARDDWHDDGVVRVFENAFASWNGSSRAFAFMSGREALGACLRALALRAGDEVVLPGYTCVVVANAIRHAGLQPVYCDIELETYGPDLDSLRQRCGPRTRAVLVHHLYGLVCRDYLPIIAFAREAGLRVIEDCAHSTGASMEGIRVGNRGDVGFYSSEQSKVFNTIQGGVAVTNDPALARDLEAIQQVAARPPSALVEKQLRNVALSYYRFRHPDHWILRDLVELTHGRHEILSTTPEELRGGVPSACGRRMPAPIASLGSNQLRKIDRHNRERRRTVERWDSWCRSSGLTRPVVLAGSEPVFLRYPVLVEPARKRDLSWAVRELGVRPGVWFVGHLHPCRESVPDCPAADEAVARCVNFPGLL